MHLFGWRPGLVALLCVGLVAAPGCSLFVPHTQRVVITPSHPEATVSVDGSVVGTGKQVMELRRNERHRVTAEYQGRVGAEAIGKKISTTGVLDIVGGCLFLIPFIGVIAPGFWDLDQTEVNVIIPEPTSGGAGSGQTAMTNDVSGNPQGPATRIAPIKPLANHGKFQPSDLSDWVGKKFEDLLPILNDPANDITLLQKSDSSKAATYTYRQGSDRFFTISVASGKIVGYTK